MKTVTFEQLLKILTKILIRVEQLETLVKSMVVQGQVDDEFLTIQEAAKLVNLSVPTLYSKVSRNEIPVNKIGKRLYFSKAELVSWIRSGRIRTTQEIQRDVESRMPSRKLGKGY